MKQHNIGYWSRINVKPPIKSCPIVTTLTCTYVARAKNKDMKTLQTRQMTPSHVLVLSSSETSPMIAATSPPGPAEHQSSVSRRTVSVLLLWLNREGLFDMNLASSSVPPTCFCSSCKPFLHQTQSFNLTLFRPTHHHYALSRFRNLWLSVHYLKIRLYDYETCFVRNYIDLSYNLEKRLLINCNTGNLVGPAAPYNKTSTRLPSPQ